MKEALYLLFLFIVVFLTAGTIAAILMGIGQRLYQNYQRRYLKSMTSSLENMFIFLNPSRILNLSFVVAIFIFFITLISTGFNLVISLALGIVGILVPRIVLNVYQKKRRKLFETQFVEGLDYLSSSVKAGLSLIQSMESLVENMAPPLSQEFDLLLREYRIGIPLNEALENFGRRLDSEELNLMVFSVIITRELGGDISEIFEHLAQVIRSRHKVLERVDTLTAQGRLQAIVCGAIPFILYGLLFFWQPDFIMPLFETFAGKVSIYVVILFQIAVIWIVRRLVNIKV